MNIHDGVVLPFVAVHFLQINYMNTFNKHDNNNYIYCTPQLLYFTQKLQTQLQTDTANTELVLTNKKI